MRKNVEKFSINFKQSLSAAGHLAMDFNQEAIAPIHILGGLSSQRGSVGAEVLHSNGITPEAVRSFLSSTTGSQSENSPAIKTEGKLIIPEFDEASRQVIAASAKSAWLNRNQFIGTEHLLGALFDAKNPAVETFVASLNLPLSQLINQAQAAIKTAGKLPDITESFKNSGKSQTETTDDDAEEGELDNFDSKNNSALEFFCRHLTSSATAKRLDPVIGRNAEIDRLAGILCRRQKNNPLLLGDPGVGKTAIVEGLAKNIHEGKVPDALADKKIYALDLTAIVAGTSYRGEFESRIKQIIDEAADRPEVILFIDEIHTIMGAGSASGSLDAANILKPALARGDIKIIGATTFGDYRKTLAGDPALSRRFQTINIEEPTAEAAKQMLLGLKKYFEGFHRLEIEIDAIEAAVELSRRYLPEKFLPDKAIDLIDEAAATIVVNRKPSKIESDLRDIGSKVKNLEKSLADLINADKYDEALDLKSEVEKIQSQVDKIKIKAEAEAKKPLGRLTAQDIAKSAANTTGISLAEISASNAKKALALEKKLANEIVGQKSALAEIAARLKLAQAGLGSVDRPIASFLFIGPSGVGKTHTARALARHYFGDEKALIKIDMSEYGEKFNASKLIGAPAGYVGYKEGGQLTDAVKRRPYSLILLDEIEKANSDIFDLFLQVLEDGYLTDAGGSKVDFKNTIIIMTSNLGSKNIGRPDIGFAREESSAQKEPESRLIGEVRQFFKPEFINRLDAIINFNQLDESAKLTIAAKELDALAAKMLANKHISLKYDRDVLLTILNNSAAKQHFESGARSIRNTVRLLVEMPLAEKILSGKSDSKKTWRLTAKNGIIAV